MFLSLTTARSFLPTHQPIAREKQTQIPNICQVLSQIAFFSLFPYFSQLNSFYLFYSIFSDLLAPNIMQLSPRAQYSLQPSELCSRIQQPPLAPYQNITVHLGCSALSPDAKNLPL